MKNEDPVYSIFKTIVATVAVAMGIGGVALIGEGFYEHYRANAATALTERATDTLMQHRLTPVAMAAFKKMHACDADHPQGAAFIARDADGKLVEGKICSGPNSDNILTMLP